MELMRPSSDIDIAESSALDIAILREAPMIVVCCSLTRKYSVLSISVEILQYTSGWVRYHEGSEEQEE